jgi:tRNA pseudouridine55 synthase
MIININKPRGVTSHDVVDAVRKITSEKRVGHAGTLDPFATGVLIVAVGRDDTKKLGAINEHSQKEYIAQVEFGKTSTTGDPEGTIKKTPQNPQKDILLRDARQTKHTIQEILKQFTGEIIQTTPVYSAVKVRGTKAYKLARQGQSPTTMPQRQVTIYEIELVKYTYPYATFHIVCSAGTYIRTLVEDIGNALGVGAYTTELTRTRIGEYTIEHSTNLQERFCLRRFF